MDGDSGSTELMLVVRDETVGITYGLYIEGLYIEKEEKIRGYS